MADGSRTATCVWTGKSGKTYTYYVYPVGTHFDPAPGNYIFTKKNSQGRWVAVYIGETGDLSGRFDNHHAMPCIKRNGATHVHAHKSSSNTQTRVNEETDLRQNYDPPCNKQ